MRPLTRSCFHLLLLLRLFLLVLPFLLGTCLISLYSPPFPLHTLAMILLSLAKVRLLPTLNLSLLTIWYYVLTALFLFLLAEDGSGVLANCSLCGTEATLSFSAGLVCFSFSAEACAIQHALRWSRQQQQVCHFSCPLLLSNSRSVLASLSSSSSFLFLKLSGRNCLHPSPVLSGYNGSPDTRFSRETTRLISWPNGERYLCPPQSLVVSLLLSLVSTLLFSRTGGVLSHRNCSTQRFPRFPPRNLCSLVTLVVFSLVYAAMDTAFC